MSAQNLAILMLKLMKMKINIKIVRTARHKCFPLKLKLSTNCEKRTKFGDFYDEIDENRGIFKNKTPRLGFQCRICVPLRID